MKKYKFSFGKFSSVLVLAVLSSLALNYVWARTWTQLSKSSEYATEIKDGGASLEVQNASFEWQLPWSSNATGTFKYSGDKKFCFTGNWSRSDSKFAITNTHGLGFRLAGGKTYRLIVDYQANFGGSRGIRLLSGSPYSSASQIHHFNTRGDRLEESFVLSPLTDTTYWLSGGGGDITQFYGFAVEVIDTEMNWYSSTSQSLAANSTFYSGKFTNNGVKKYPNNGIHISKGGNQYPTYDFSNAANDYISFTLLPGSGYFRVFSKEAPSSTSMVTASQSLTLSDANFNVNADNGANTLNTVSGNTITFGEAFKGAAWLWSSDYPTGYDKFTLDLESAAGYNIQIIMVDSNDNAASEEMSGQVADTHIEVTIDPNKSYSKVYIQNCDAGDLTISSATFTRTETVGAGSQKTVKIYKGDSYAGKTEVTAPINYGGTADGVYTTINKYNFVNEGETTYYVTGGMIGAIEVVYDVDVATLRAIDEDWIWYAYGDDLWQNPQGTYLAVNHTPFDGGDAVVTVNGSNTKSVHSTTGKNTNKLTLTTDSDPYNHAVAFKLKDGLRYRIQIFAHEQVNAQSQIFKTSRNAAANYSLGSAVWVSTPQNQGGEGGWQGISFKIDNDTYLYTFEVDNKDKGDVVVWIQPAQTMNIGAIQVLPYEYKVSLPNTMTPLGHNDVWTVAKAKTSQKEAMTSRGLDVDIVRGGSLYIDDNFYIYGPSLTVNETTLNYTKGLSSTDPGKTVLLNVGNGIGFKLANKATVTVTYKASNKDYLTIAKQPEFSSPKSMTNVGTRSTSVNADETDVHQNTYKNESGSPETIWITNSASGTGCYDYVYLSGIYVEIDPTALQTIPDDSDHEYYWQVENDNNSTVTQGDKFSGNHFVYRGDGTSVSSPAVTVPTASDATAQQNAKESHDSWTFTGGNDFLGFRLLAGRRGKVKVWYSQNNDLGANMTSGNTSAYDPSTRTIHFPGYWEEDDENNYGDCMIGWWFGTGDAAANFTGVGTLSFEFDTTTAPIDIVFQDTDDNIKSFTISVSSSKYSVTLSELSPTVDITKIKQIWFFCSSPTPCDLTIVSALKGEAKHLTIATGTNEDDQSQDYKEINTRVTTSIPYSNDTDNDSPTKASSQNTQLMTYTFNNSNSLEDILYWLSGDVNIAAVEVIYDEEPEELATSKGANGYIYINHGESKKAFPFEPRLSYQNVDQIGVNLLQIKSGDVNTMKFLPGTLGVKIYRNNEQEKQDQFIFGGVKFEGQVVAPNQGGNIDKVVTSYAAVHYNSSGNAITLLGEELNYQVNADPQTECNRGVGGASTENGGMFLQPVSGDFFRFEPEYDGVVTMYILQNGNTDGETKYTGKLTRRPTYVMDENGYIMRRSTIKPAFDHLNNPSHYAIDGTWADLNPESPIRDDYADAWNIAIAHWNGDATKYNGFTKSSYKDDWSKGADNSGTRYKEAMRFYDFWYDGGSYSFDAPGDVITLEDWVVDEDGTADDWGAGTTLTSNTTVLDQNMQIGLIAYRSDNLKRLEGQKGLLKSGLNSFADYGYEVPVHVHTRFVFPVRAGKTYYLAGRGTKNGFMGVKFDPMTANYDAKDYRNPEYNYWVGDGPNRGKYMLSRLGSGDHNETPNVYSRDEVNNYIGTYSDIPTVAITPTSGDDFSWTNKDKTVKVTLSRSFKAGQWYPIVLPFSVSESKMREIFGADVQVLYLDPWENVMTNKSSSNLKGGQTGDWTSAITPAVYENKLRLTRHYYQMLYANTPAFICPGGKTGSGTNFTEVSSVTFDRVHLEQTNYAADKITIIGKNNSEISFPVGYKIGENAAGTYEFFVVGDYKQRTDLDLAGVSTEMYFMDNVDGKAVFYHSATGVDMKGTRCWIVGCPKSSTNTGAPARLSEIAFGMFYDDEDFDMDNAEAGIEDIVMDDIVVDMYNFDDNVYDLMGRVVGRGTLQGMRPGIYIFQGKKVYIR